jgi:Pyruvate/2-oxoacid:ferredoxin oxidoreductase delta subunit
MAHVTFKQMMNEVVAFGSCCECGTCVLVCPHNVIDYVDGKPKQVAKATAAFDYCGMSGGIGCDVCAQVCPRLGVREFESRRRHPWSRRARGRLRPYRRIVAALQGSRSRALPGRRRRDRVLAHGSTRACSTGVRVGGRSRDASRLPKPKVVTTVDEAIGSASSWYTYCPNDLASRTPRSGA